MKLTTERIAALRRTGDPEADRVIETATGGAVHRLADLLDALLAVRDDAASPPEHGALPAPVAAFLQQDPGLPAWAEPARLARAAELHDAARLHTFLVLAMASLPSCYRVPSIAATLMASGRLAAQTFRRLRETADFTGAVLSPRGMDPGGVGRRWCRRLRLVHAAMRGLARRPVATAPTTGRELQDFLLRTDLASPDRDPIDQLELAFVLQTFAIVVVRALPRVGVKWSADDRRSYLHAWSVVGALIGVPEDVLPRDGARIEVEAAALFAAIAAADQQSSDAARLLTGALLVVTRRAIWQAVPALTALRPHGGSLPARALRLLPRALVGWLDRCLDAFLTSLPRSLLRDLIGRRPAQELGVDRAPLVHWLGHRLVYLVAALAGQRPIRLRAFLDWRRLALLRVAARMRARGTP